MEEITKKHDSLGKSARQAIVSVAKSLGVPPERIAAGIAAMQGTHETKAHLEPLAVRQAGVCGILSCSRHHVRKLEKLGLLTAVDLAGAKRYRVSDILKLLGAV